MQCLIKTNKRLSQPKNTNLVLFKSKTCDLFVDAFHILLTLAPKFVLGSEEIVLLVLQVSPSDIQY